MRFLRSGTVVVAAALTALLLSNRCSGSLYSLSVLADGPAAFWRFNELVTTAGALDVSGFGRNGTYTNVESLTLGEPGPRPADGFGGLGADNSAVAFSGSGHVAMPAGFLPTGSSSRTFTGWFKQTSNSAQGWLNYGRDATPNRNSITAGPDRVAVAVSGHNYGVDNLGLSDGWHHFGVIFPDGATQSDEWQFVVDGVDRTADAVGLAGETRTVNTIDDNPLRRIGIGVGGFIDEVAVFDKALNVEDVQRQYQAALGTWNGTVDIDAFEFQTAAKDGQSPATSGAFAGAELYVRSRGNETPEQPHNKVHAFLRFDLGELEDVSFQSATLNLHQYNKLNNLNSGDLFLAKVTEAWDPDVNTPSFDQLIDPDSEFLFGDNGPAYEGPAYSQLFEIDLTEMVRDWLADPSSNHGVRLRIEDHFVGAAFNHDGALAPKLVIIVPEPSAWLLLLAALTCGLLLRRRGEGKA